MPDFLDPDVTFVDSPRPPNGDFPGNVAADGARTGATQIRISGQAWYDDGTGAAIDGADRPGAREISNAVFKQTDASGAFIDKPNAAGFSSLLWVWGQFIDHDMDQTATSAASGSAPIAIPDGDPMRDAGVTALNFVRSTPVAGSSPRDFPNQITGFLDASMVYGSTQAKLNALLEPGTAKLRLSSAGTILFDQNDAFFGNGFIAGDTRANENVGLLSMQALFAREHNRIVDALVAADPTLTVAEQFQGARARVEALVQAITYNEYLPKLLGTTALPSYAGFDSTVNPAISIEFSTAVYRLGHTLLSPVIKRTNEDGSTDERGDLALMDAFQQRGVVEQTGIEDILRGMATSKSQALDTFMVEDVRSFLFNAGGGAFGNDLAALNIQRGRDHGLPSYNEMRVALGLAARASFAEVTSDAEVAARLEAAYGTIDKLDLWVGGLAEDAVGDGMVGEVFRAVLIDQFARLRAGDPMWSQIRGFGADELDQLWSTTLSDVIMRNSDVTTMQGDAMLAYNRIAGTNAANTLNAAAGRNLLIGLGGADTLNGGADADHLSGGPGNDRLFGNAGDDFLDPGLGTDTVSGGDGDDVIYITDPAVNTDAIDGGAGIDTVIVAERAGVVTLTTTARMVGVEVFDGGGQEFAGTDANNTIDFSVFTTVRGVVSFNAKGGNDVVTGSAGADTLIGNTGNDTLRGGAGDDTLQGGKGDDVLDGGPGADILRGADGADVIIVRGAEAIDDVIDGGAGSGDVLRIEAGAALTLRGTGNIANIEIIEGNGATITGDAGANVFDFSGIVSASGIAAIHTLAGADTIIGTNAADAIFAGAGADLIDGRGGDDRMTGGDGNDTFRFVATSASGHDTILDFDAKGNDVIQLLGFSGLEGLTAVERFAAVESATTFAGGGATLSLADLGGTGDVFLAGATTARLSFTAEDFVFA